MILYRVLCKTDLERTNMILVAEMWNVVKENKISVLNTYKITGNLIQLPVKIKYEYSLFILSQDLSLSL